MKIRSKIIISVICFGLLSIANKPNRKASYFSYTLRFDSSSLLLKENGKFIQYKRSCTYAFKASGTWSTISDTIALKQDKIKWLRGNGPYDKRANKLLILSSDSLQYVFDREFGFGDSFVLTLQK